jgi:hypothetical protein
VALEALGPEQTHELLEHHGVVHRHGQLDVANVARAVPVAQPARRAPA